MSGLRIGSLFSGYGGLEQGVQSVLGGTVAWHSDIDPGACKILAHRYPDVPNLGDITAVDWIAVEPVDVLTGGFPCQDVSSAGKRAGLNNETRSGLWAQMARAIDEMRPPLVVAENVRGLLSACALSELEPCPRCLGDESQPHRPVLRALGRVLGDLAELGYDARWGGLRAADVGAPHGRFRVFVAAWPAGSNPAELGCRPARRDDRLRPSRLVPQSAAHAQDDGRERGRPSRLGRDGSANDGRRTVPDAASDGRDEGRTEPAGLIRGSHVALGGDAAAHSDSAGLGRLEEHHSAPQAGHGTGHGDDADGLALASRGVEWGQYEPAIRRWERCLGRPAPAPTERGKNGQPRLAPAFVEFLMGLPAGWVTQVPRLGRNEQLKALGNGVVPQQAAQALRMLLPAESRAAA